jgi:hypothetical protein
MFFGNNVRFDGIGLTSRVTGVGGAGVNFGRRTTDTTAVAEFFTNKAADVTNTRTTVASFTQNGIWTFPSGIRGSDGTAAATAGNIGEQVISNSSGGTEVVAPNSSTGIWGNFTSISLTAGEWDISCGISQRALLSGQTDAGVIAISVDSNSTTSAALSDESRGNNWMFFSPAVVSGSQRGSISIPQYRLRITSTTTIYLKGTFVYSSNASTVFGYRISATRVR